MRELARLRADIGKASDGQGRIVLIAGEPGIGKTWLVRAALAQSTGDDAGFDVRWARCTDAIGAPAYWPWRQLLGSDFDDGWRGTEDGSDGERFERVHAIVRRIAEASAGRPLVLAIDDVQWADEGSVLVLDVLAQEIESWRVVVLATMRDVGDRGEGRDALTALRRHKSVRHLLLAGLEEAETRHLANALVGDIVPDRAVDALQRATAGNPYFIGELLHVLTPEDLRHLAGSGEALTRIPEGVEQLIVNRLDGCDAPTREMLELAAVMDPTFPVTRLTMPGAAFDDAAERDRLLDRAVQERLIEPAEEAGRFRFVHGLVPSAILRRLTANRLAELHGRVGLLLEAEGGTAVVTSAELARHFVAAVTRPGLAERALRHSRQAARDAAAQCAYDLAARHYRNAVAALEAMPPEATENARNIERAEVLLGLARSLASGGDPEAGAILDQVESLAGAAVDSPAHARAARLLALASVVRCEGLSPATASECRAGIDRGARALAAIGTSIPDLRARLLAALTPLYRFESEREGVRSMAREASDLAAASGDASLQGRALEAVHWALLDEPSAEERLGVASRALNRAETSNDRRLAARARFWRYLDLLELGRTDDADAELVLLERLADQLREPRWRHRALYLRAGLELHQGRLARAETLAGEALQIGLRAGVSEADVVYLTAISVVCFARNDFTRMADLHRYGAETRAQFPQTRAGASILLAWQGRMRSAQDDLAMVLDAGLDAIPRGPDWLGTMQTLAWSAMETDDRLLCQAIFDRLHRHAERTILHHLGSTTGGTVARVLANLGAKLGRSDADTYFRDAVDLAHRSRGGFDLIFLPLEWAAMHLARGAGRDDPTVVRLLAEALDRARAAGATRAEQQVRALNPGLVDAADARIGRSVANRFQQLGAVWSIGFRGRACELPDSRGLQFIAALLKRPGQEILATDLVAEVTGETDVPVEVARLRVTQRIRSALERLRDAHPAIAAHLGTYVRTGKYCGYLPRGEDRMDWRLDGVDRETGT